MNITYDSSGVEMSNACFQQATYDFSEVKKSVNGLNTYGLVTITWDRNDYLYIDSIGITYCLPKSR